MVKLSKSQPKFSSTINTAPLYTEIHDICSISVTIIRKMEAFSTKSYVRFWMVAMAANQGFYPNIIILFHTKNENNKVKWHRADNEPFTGYAFRQTVCFQDLSMKIRPYLRVQSVDQAREQYLILMYLIHKIYYLNFHKDFVPR